MLKRRIGALRRRGGLLVMVALVAVALVACRQSAGGVPLNGASGEGAPVRIALAADSEEMIMGPLVWHVTLTDADGRPIEDAVVSLRGDMHHAGMVPVEAMGTHNGGGVYSADFEWTMAGDWFVTVTAEMPDGTTAAETFDYTVRTQ